MPTKSGQDLTELEWTGVAWVLHSFLYDMSLRKVVQVEVDVLVEIPKGTRNKYEYDHERRVIRFDRMLFSAVHYPTDYGFIVDTLAGDGDALDALVLVWEPTFPGCLIRAKPIGLFRMVDERGPDEKILTVPVADPMWNALNSVHDVPKQLLNEIEHFFQMYKDLEKKKTDVGGWEDEKAAIEVIKEAQAEYAGRR